MGRQGSGEGEFEEPRDITVDSNGNVLVTDTRRNTLLIFDKNGTFIRVRQRVKFLLTDGIFIKAICPITHFFIITCEMD